MAFDTTLTDGVVKRHTDAGFWGRTHPDYFDRAVQAHPGRRAVVDRGQTHTFAELDRLVARAAYSFLDHGIRPGHVVAIQLPGWVEFLVGHYALARIGAVTLPLLLDYRVREMEFMLNFAGAHAVIVPGVFRDTDHAALLREVLPQTPSVKRVFVVGETSAEWTPFAELIDPAIDDRYDPERVARCRPVSTDVLEIVFTSGTTGNPKAILHTHDTFMCVAERMVRDFEYASDDVVLGLSPLAHQHGILGHLAPPVVAGATTALLERFQPVAALELIEAFGVTIVVGVPSHAFMLLGSEALDRCRTKAWRLFFCSGATLPMEVATRLYQAFGCRITSAYGMSEAAYCTYSRMDDPFEVVASSCGRPAAGSEIRIYDGDGAECATGVVGEIAMRGPNVFVGYHSNLDTARALTNEAGFFRSGDLGLMREDGNLVVVGRAKDMILRGGDNVYPSEIEEDLLRHPKIANVAVVGYADERLGERVCACVIPLAGQSITLEEIRAFLEGRIARYKIPDRLETLNAFPMTGTGKVQKTRLREVIAGARPKEDANG